MLGLISPRLTYQRLRGQNTSVGIGLIEIIEQYVILNYKTLFDITFYKLFYTYFCLYLSGTKLFVHKTAAFYICLIWFGVSFNATALKVLVFFV